MNRRGLVFFAIGFLIGYVILGTITRPSVSPSHPKPGEVWTSTRSADGATRHDVSQEQGTLTITHTRDWSGECEFCAPEPK
jgi:hypothetical protein